MRRQRKKPSAEARARYDETAFRTPRGRLSRAVCFARVRARKRGLQFELDLDWALGKYVAQGGACALSGIPFEFHRSSDGSGYAGPTPWSPSLDRIDPDGPYTKANTRLVCTAMNLALNRYGEESFRDLARAYLRNRGNQASAEDAET